MFIKNNSKTIIGVVIFLVIISLLYCFEDKIPGFGPSKIETESTETALPNNYKKTITYQIVARKNVWDYLQLLIVPLALVLIAFLFNQSEKREEDKRAIDNQYESALQIYFKAMSELLLNHKLLNSEKGHPVRDVAQIHTLTTLHRVDPERKGSIISFLNNAGLINTDDTLVSLEYADLYEADLKGQTLDKANFCKAVLTKADFRACKLKGVDFTDAKMDNAILRNADLATAILNEPKSTKLENASYDDRTVWPPNYKYENTDAIKENKYFERDKKKEENFQKKKAKKNKN